MHEPVFKHLKQLVQRTEPAEPLITVIYKPDSTLMRRQKLPSSSFSLVFLSSTHLSSHPFSPSWFFFTAPCSHKISASIIFSFLPDHSHGFLCCSERKKSTEAKKVSRVEEFPYKQRKMYFCTLQQTNTPLGLTFGGLRNLGTASEQTFLGDCLACVYAWMDVTEWERRHLICSHAPEPAGLQQRRHYGRAPASFFIGPPHPLTPPPRRV